MGSLRYASLANSCHCYHKYYHRNTVSPRRVYQTALNTCISEKPSVICPVQIQNVKKASLLFRTLVSSSSSGVSEPVLASGLNSATSVSKPVSISGSEPVTNPDFRTSFYLRLRTSFELDFRTRFQIRIRQDLL
jgi:hypothetical protein